MAQDVCSIVSSDDRARLEAIVADRNRAHKHVLRARIIRHTSERLRVAEVARRVGVAGRRSGAGSGASPWRVSTACCGMPPASPARRPWTTPSCVGWWR
jgi:hypothetical protein